MEELIAMECKCCGARMNPADEHGGVIRCAYCGYYFTRPKKEGTPAVLSFLRTGEHELDTGKFDEAFTAFQKAAELDGKEPEAYWGMALAQFKIQYLKDTVNNRLQPICHDISSKKFTDSKHFLSALRYATEEQRTQYESKGEEIDYIQGEFYKMQQSGLNYDCFLCVKVTGENGDKTEDYKDADYIYTLLQDKGFTPFFSERNIRNKTGADYEAQILYALKTAESMLVICRNEEYLQTPWVKNEYTRFLRLINDEEKESDAITFVYYKKPIEKLPGKKGKIQGIDFSLREADGKIADFVETHTPEAKKRREAEARKKQQAAEEQARQISALREQIETIKSSTAQTDTANVSVKNLLIRAKQQVEAGNLSKAAEYYTKVLDSDPTNCESWWGSYLLEYNCTHESQLLKKLDPETLSTLHTSSNYRNAKKYANGEFANRIKRYEEACLSYARKNAPALKKEKEAFDRETQTIQREWRQEVAERNDKKNRLTRRIDELERKESKLLSKKDGNNFSPLWYLLILLSIWGIILLLIVKSIKKKQAGTLSKGDQAKLSETQRELSSVQSAVIQWEHDMEKRKDEYDLLMKQRNKKYHSLQVAHQNCCEYINQYNV